MATENLKMCLYLPSWWVADLELLPHPASPERKAPHMASLRKDHNSQLKLQFLLNPYHFCLIIKARNCKSELVRLYSYMEEQLLQILLKKILKKYIFGYVK